MKDLILHAFLNKNKNKKKWNCVEKNNKFHLKIKEQKKNTWDVVVVVVNS